MLSRWPVDRIDCLEVVIWNDFFEIGCRLMQVAKEIGGRDFHLSFAYLQTETRYPVFFVKVMRFKKKLG